MPKAQKFWTDFGLTPQAVLKSRATFSTANGATVVLRRRSDKSLPPAVEDGPSARLITWGLKTAADLADLKERLRETGNLLDSTAEDCRIQYEGNFRSVFYALKAVLPPLIKQKSGQVVINTSASGLRPAPWAAVYSAMRMGANALVRCAGQTVGPHGVSVNATGTYAMDYPSFLHDVGADKDPSKRKDVEAGVPLRRLCQPEEAAHFVASLIDGKNAFQTSQFFAIDGGWAFE